MECIVLNYRSSTMIFGLQYICFIALNGSGLCLNWRANTSSAFSNVLCSFLWSIMYIRNCHLKWSIAALIMILRRIKYIEIRQTSKIKAIFNKVCLKFALVLWLSLYSGQSCSILIVVVCWVEVVNEPAVFILLYIIIVFYLAI